MLLRKLKVGGGETEQFCDRQGAARQDREGIQPLPHVSRETNHSSFAAKGLHISASPETFKTRAGASFGTSGSYCPVIYGANAAEGF